MAKEYMMNWEEYRKYNNSGIYLIAVQKKPEDEPIIVYVGKSKNMYTRVRQHIRAILEDVPKERKYQILHNVFVNHYKVKFDVLEYCDESELTNREKEWIGCLRPSLNTVGMQDGDIDKRLAADLELAWLLDLKDGYNWED